MIQRQAHIYRKPQSDSQVAILRYMDMFSPPRHRLTRLDCKSKEKKIHRTVYRYSPPNRIAITWNMHIGNIRTTHKYTKSGVGSVYSTNSAKTAMAEISHWDVDLDSVVLVNKKAFSWNIVAEPSLSKKLSTDILFVLPLFFDGFKGFFQLYKQHYIRI